MGDRRTALALLLVLVILVTGIIAASVFRYENQRARYRARAERELAAIADLKVGDIALWRKEHLASAKVLYKNAAFSSLVRCFERTEDLPLQEELRSWISHTQAYHEYDRAALTATALANEAGQIYAVATTERERGLENQAEEGGVAKREQDRD